MPGSHSHSVSVEYITVEKEANVIDGRIAGLMSNLGQNTVEKEKLEAKLR